MATEQSDKIVAAGAELGVTRIHTGPVTPVKIRIAVEELIKDIDAAAPLKNLMQKINEARNNSEWAASTAILEELYKKDPKNKRVVYELAENYLQEKKWQRSYELLKPLIGAMPPDSRILHAAGKALIKLGKPEDAAAVMQKADFINPFNVERLLDLGNVFLTLDKTRKASEIFDRAGQLDPENPEVAKGQGTAKLMDGDVNEALRIMKDAVTGRELASVFNTAAVLSMRLGRFPKGLNLYEAAEKVLKDKPDILARIFFNKGLGFYRWKKLEDAQKCFEQALKLDPAYINAQHNLRAVIAELTQPKSMAAGAEVPSGLDDVKFDDSMKDVFNDNLMEEDERI